MLGGRIDRAALRRFAVGDLLAILAFVLAGEYRHGIDPLVAPLVVAGTLVPFLVGWAVGGPLAGAYRGHLLAGGLAGDRAILGRTAAGWVLGVAIAMALRSTAVFHGGVQLSFALVSLGFGGLFLLAWRLVAVRLP